MAAETVPGSGRESAKRLNWNEIFRHSFLFSQGDGLVQEKIFRWLATGPFKGVTSETIQRGIKPGLASSYVRHLQEQEMHPPGLQPIESTGVSGDEDRS